MSQITVEVSRNGHVAQVRFAKPPFNYACPALLARLADALDEIDADPAIRCSALIAQGKAFCAGADLAGDESMTGEAGMTAIAGLYREAERLFRRRKPMVAAIQGAAIGAGLGLALTADFRVAGPAARLSSNFVRLGFHPGFALTCTLPRLVGPQKAAWMMLSAARMKPDEALACGLVDAVAPDDDVTGAALRMAEQIAANAPLALMATRASMLGDLGDRIVAAMRHEHAQQTLLKATADYAEGVASVFERRDANFTGA